MGAPTLPPRLEEQRNTVFVGRRAEVATLSATWEAARQRKRHAMFIGGAPGAGKSRLAAELALSVDEHTLVMLGTSHPDFSPPFGPFVEAIDRLFLTSEPGTLPDIEPELAGRMLRLSAHVTRHAQDGAVHDESEVDTRRSLFDAVASLFALLSQERSVLLVIEDLHWAGAPTMQLLSHVVRTTGDAALLVLATHRTTAPDRSDPVTYAIADLYRLPGVGRLDLGGLGADEVCEFLVLATGTHESVVRAPAAVLRDQTGGNPLFLHEIWRAVARAGGLRALQSASIDTPVTIRETIEERLRALGAGQRDIIEAAAIIGERFSLRSVISTVDVPPSEAMAAVDRSVELGLLSPLSDEAATFAFVHALGRQAVLDGLATFRRAELHAAVAETLAREGSDEPRDAAALAHHYLEASLLGFSDDALRQLMVAADFAESSLAFEEAADHLRKAVPLAPSGGRSELLFRAARNHVQAGDFAAGRSLYAELAEDPDPQVQTRAALGFEDACWRPGLSSEQALVLLGRAASALVATDTDTDYIRLLASMGRALSFLGEISAAQATGERAIRLAREVGDVGVLATALQAALWHGLTPAQASQQRARAREGSHLALGLGDFELLGQAATYRGALSYVLGEPDEWATAESDLDLAATKTGQPFYQYMLGCSRSLRRFNRGDFSGAERAAEELLSIGAAFRDDDTEGLYGLQMYMIRRATGRLPALRPMFTGKEDAADHWAPGLLSMYVELGMHAPARRVLDELIGHDLEGDAVRSSQWPAVAAFIVDAAVALQDPGAAEAIRPALAPYAGHNMVAGHFVAGFGSADRYLAQIEALLDRPGEAQEHFEYAVEMDARMGSTVHKAESLNAYARFLSGIGDPDRAHRMRSEAMAMAHEIGLVRLEPMAAEPIDVAGLTPRELDVLVLITEGLSNREIGNRLCISQNTAANHVRSILMKTGSTNRTQAAIYATDHDLVEDAIRRE